MFRRRDTRSITNIVRAVTLLAAGLVAYSLIGRGARAEERQMPPQVSAYLQRTKSYRESNPSIPPFFFWGYAVDNGTTVTQGAPVEAWLDVNGDDTYTTSGVPTPTGSENFNTGSPVVLEGDYVCLEIRGDDPSTIPIVEGYDLATTNGRILHPFVNGRGYTPVDLRGFPGSGDYFIVFRREDTPPNITPDMIKNYLLGRSDLTEAEREAADFNRDNKIDIADLLLSSQ